MVVKLRTMNAADRPALVRILRHTPEFKTYEVTVAEEVIDSYLHDPKGSGYHIIVAEGNPAPTGYVCYGPTPCTDGTWYIYWIAVSREGRGQGIGAALTRAAEAEIQKARGRMIIIETSSTPIYEQARRLYLGRGYEVVGRVPDFYTSGDDKLILQKRLK